MKGVKETESVTKYKKRIEKEKENKNIPKKSTRKYRKKKNKENITQNAKKEMLGGNSTEATT